MAAISRVPGTTIPYVLKYITTIATLKIKEAGYIDPDVSVETSAIVDPQNVSDFVIIGEHIRRNVETRRIVGGGGAHWMREDYNISVQIICSDLHAEGFDSIVPRAYRLLDLVEQVVRDDVTLNSLVILSEPMDSDGQHGYSEDHNGPQVVINSFIRVLAEL